MTHTDPVTGAPEPVDPSGTTSNGHTDPWKEVVRSLDDFGRAVTEWGEAVREDPDNRRRMKELQSLLESMGKSIGEMADSASKSDVAKEMGAAFVATGEVVVSSAKRVTDEVSPFVATAFRTAASVMHEAAVRIEKKGSSAAESTEATAGAEAPGGPVVPVPGTPTEGPMSDEEPPRPEESDVPEGYVP